jgi:hypothetical protein
MEETLKDYLSAGFIRPSHSLFCSPVLFAKKPDGRLRNCVDYRKLNSLTKRNFDLLSNKKDRHTRLHGSKVFSKINQKNAFHLLRVFEGHESKTAFSLPLRRILVLGYAFCVD